MTSHVEVSLEGRRLTLSNLDKVLYPAVGFTKAQVIDYYTRVAPALLPHLKGRALTLKRYPDGVEGEYFYEKECPSHRPSWVPVAPIPHDRKTGVVNYCVINELPALVWAANLADLELHTSLSLARDPDRPTVLVFDLDPGLPATVIDCARVGITLGDMLSELGLESFPKTSGGKGLQIYVPLNTAVDYAATKPLALALAGLLEKYHPDGVTSKMSKSARPGKVFVDWSQNDRHKTTVCVYSLRARERPLVSTPVRWEELEKAVKKEDPSLLLFDSEQVISRISRLGDLFEPVLRLKQKLPAHTRNRKPL